MDKKLIIAVIALILTAGCAQAATVSSSKSLTAVKDSGMVVVDDFDDEILEYDPLWGWLKRLFSGKGKVRLIEYGGIDDGLPYSGNGTSTYGVGIGF